MWLNVMFLIGASLCVAIILGWVVSRPKRWGVFGAGTPKAPEDQTGADPFARRA
jgi:hypothetical protein